jgi:hypothetical protein
VGNVKNDGPHLVEPFPDSLQLAGAGINSEPMMAVQDRFVSDT